MYFEDFNNFELMLLYFVIYDALSQIGFVGIDTFVWGKNLQLYVLAL